MKLVTKIIVFALVIGLFGCKNSQSQSFENTALNSNKVAKQLTDYKSDTYQVYIGESYKLTDDVIDWGWAGENDPDGMVDSTGIDAFLCLNEPLLNYNETQYLPSLHIRTNKNIITEFSCSMLFNLKENSIDAKREYLRLMSKDISRLRDENIVETLINEGIYEISNNDFIEILTFEKGEGYGYDKFEYEIRFKE